MGPAGPAGAAGPAGPAGSAGSAGSQILDGAGVPANGLGNDGDWYIDTVNGNAYKKITGAWVFQLTLKGASGASGIRDGAGVPNNADGSDGNYYLNDSIGDWYLKTAGVWNRVYKSTVDLSGTNTTLSGVVSIAHGGTGASTQQTALNALASVAGTLDFDLLTRFAGGNWGGLHAPTVAPTTKFLRGDLQWQVPPSPTGVVTNHVSTDSIDAAARRAAGSHIFVAAHLASIATVTSYRAVLVCTNAGGDGTWSQNDEVDVTGILGIYVGPDFDIPFSVTLDATNITFAVDPDVNLSNLNVVKKDGSADVDILPTLNKWTMRIRWTTNS